MRSWWRMLQVAVSTKTHKFGAAARHSQVSPPRTHYDRGWESHPVVVTGIEDTGDVGPRVVGMGMEYHSKKIT